MTRQQSDGASSAGKERPDRLSGPLDLSVVVVSWNSARFLGACLDSLLGQREVSVEVIMVDNGSTDRSVEIARGREPRVRVIELGENRGFCAANNIGLARARAPFVLFANPDIILADRFALEALAPFSRDARIGIVGGKLLRFDGRTVDSAGQFLARSRRIVDRGYGKPADAETEIEGYVFSICGAAMLCRREMIEDVSVDGQYFDETFFAFSEDLDVAWRARLGGWRSYYAPRAVGCHYRGGSEAEAAGRRWLPAIVRRPRTLRFHVLKNRWLTLIKNDTASSLLRDLPFVAARDVALIAIAAAASPGVLVDLFRARSLWRQAAAKRGAFLGRTGRWGPRQAGARREWVAWDRPSPADPEVA